MTGGSGITGAREALRAQQQLINVEASNLVRSQVPGAKEVRATLRGDAATDIGGGIRLAGPGVSINATSTDFSQGQLVRTGFTTDLAISGEGFFTLFDSKGEYYFTRRGDFHFDTDGSLVNKDGLWVASFDHETGELEKTTIKVNPVTDTFGEQVLDELEANGPRQAADLATDLGVPLATLNTKLAELKTAGYVNEFQQAGNTLFESNLGKLGDQILFDSEGFVINATRGRAKGNQIALAVFPNNQGLVSGRFGGEVFKATDAAVPGGIPEFGGPGDVSLGLGRLESQTLEQSTSSVSSSAGFLGILQRNFTSSTAAVKTFLTAWDDLLSVFR